MTMFGVPAAKSDGLDWFRNGICYQIFPDRFARVDDGNQWELDHWGSEPTRTNYMGGNLRGVTSKLDYLQGLGVKSLYSTPIFDAPANHRYDTHDYLQLAPMLGSESDLRDLVSVAQSKGIGVILDGVFNHAGETFEPFVKALAGDSDARKLFHFHSQSNAYQTVGGAKFMPKLNHESKEIFSLVEAVLQKWDEFGISGWRLDVPWKVPNEFWAAVRQRTAALQSSQLWIAEAWAQWNFAEDFNSIMNYHARNRLLDLVHLHHADAEDFFRDLAQWTMSWSDPSLLLNVVGSHDTARILTMCKGNPIDAQIILSLNALIPGVPMLYYGDEIGMEGENDPGCRGAFPTEVNAVGQQFRSVVLPVFQLRALHRSLSHGSLAVETLRNHSFVFVREFGDCRIRVAGNTSDQVEYLDAANGKWTSIVGGIPVSERGLKLAPRSLAIEVSSECAC